MCMFAMIRHNVSAAECRNSGYLFSIGLFSVCFSWFFHICSHIFKRSKLWISSCTPCSFGDHWRGRRPSPWGRRPCRIRSCLGETSSWLSGALTPCATKDTKDPLTEVLTAVFPSSIVNAKGLRTNKNMKKHNPQLTQDACKTFETHGIYVNVSSKEMMEVNTRISLKECSD